MRKTIDITQLLIEHIKEEQEKRGLHEFKKTILSNFSIDELLDEVEDRLDNNIC